MSGFFQSLLSLRKQQRTHVVKAITKHLRKIYRPQAIDVELPVIARYIERYISVNNNSRLTVALSKIIKETATQNFYNKNTWHFLPDKLKKLRKELNNDEEFRACLLAIKDYLPSKDCPLLGRYHTQSLFNGGIKYSRATDYLNFICNSIDGLLKELPPPPVVTQQSSMASTLIYFRNHFSDFTLGRKLLWFGTISILLVSAFAKPMTGQNTLNLEENNLPNTCPNDSSYGSTLNLLGQCGMVEKPAPQMSPPQANEQNMACKHFFTYQGNPLNATRVLLATLHRRGQSDASSTAACINKLTKKMGPHVVLVEGVEANQVTDCPVALGHRKGRICKGWDNMKAHEQMAIPELAYDAWLKMTKQEHQKQKMSDKDFDRHLFSLTLAKNSAQSKILSDAHKVMISKTKQLRKQGMTYAEIFTTFEQENTANIKNKSQEKSPHHASLIKKRNQSMVKALQNNKDTPTFVIAGAAHIVNKVDHLGGVPDPAISDAARDVRKKLEKDKDQYPYVILAMDPQANADTKHYRIG